MQPHQVVALTIQCAMGVAAIRPLFIAFVPNRLRLWFESGPEAIARVVEPRDKALVSQLTSLGFFPVGVTIEKRLLRAPSRELAFVLDGSATYASLFLRKPGGKFCFIILLEGGGFVLTSNALIPQIATARLRQRSVDTTAVALFELHRQDVNELREAGCAERAPADADFRGDAVRAAVLDANRDYYGAPEIKRMRRKSGVVVLILLAVAVAAVSGCAWFWGLVLELRQARHGL